MNDMQIRTLYFARLREAFATAGEAIELPEAATVADLLQLLQERGGSWRDELTTQRIVRVAVNQDMATAQTVLRAGDEVALFPPVTGG